MTSALRALLLCCLELCLPAIFKALFQARRNCQKPKQRKEGKVSFFLNTFNEHWTIFQPDIKFNW